MHIIKQYLSAKSLLKDLIKAKRTKELAVKMI